MFNIFSYSCCKLKYTKITNKFSNYLNLLLKKQMCNETGTRPLRHYSLETTENRVSQNERFIPFLERINLRQAEAKRSILVQVQSSQSFKELHTYCSSIGTIKQMFHYTTGVEPLHFIIVEFVEELDVANILNSSSYIEENLAVPSHSQFLWFRASNRKQAKLKQSKTAKLSVLNATDIITESEIKDLLKNCENISEQMEVLYNSTYLNDVGIRLRYLTARQIECMVTGIFPFARAYPFGSSVNGCGKMGCDLDLVLRLIDEKVNDDSRLIFHCKSAFGSERIMSQRHMESIADLIHMFLPGCAQVRRILQARVPIIKFHQQLTDVECDLSMGNMSGVYMSDFLYMMGELDKRVRPLIFTIRRWAKEVGLTNSSPGRWISNFSVTLLVLAFLQRPLNSQPVLPSLNTLVQLAGPNDKYITEEGVNCTFLRDLNKYKHRTTNTDSIESLLCQFFEYYSQFDFSSKAICLNEAVALTKPEYSPMYIVNPLERGLNVSKNVSLEEVERFKVEVRNAAWTLESQENKTGNWGLLGIFENRRENLNLNFALSAKQRRLMEVSTLFKVEDERKEDEEKNGVIEFKSEQLKREVQNIKKATKEKIKSIENNMKRQKSQR